MDKKKIAIIIGLFFGVGLLVLGFTQMQRLGIFASDETPRDVTITDISISTVKVQWSTSARTQGVVEYGTTPTALNSFSPESENATSHEVELTLLTETTTYYFQISIGGKKYDNGGVPWTFATKGPGEETSNGDSDNTTSKPTPVSTVVIPGPGESTCKETSCEAIKDKLGDGCTTTDYIKCIRTKLTPTAGPSQ